MNPDEAMRQIVAQHRKSTFISLAMLAAALVGVLLIAALSGCGRDPRSDQPPGDELPPPKRVPDYSQEPTRHYFPNNLPKPERLSEEEFRRRMEKIREAGL